jgi:polar amino acid transport system substrate-binding protein
MKKLMAALLVGTMVFSLSACGSKDTASTDAQTEAATGAAEEGSEATDAAEDAESTGGTLVMATNAEFPPYEYYEGGEVVGIDADIAQAIADELGMELQIDDGIRFYHRSRTDRQSRFRCSRYDRNRRSSSECKFL